MPTPFETRQTATKIVLVLFTLLVFMSTVVSPRILLAADPSASESPSATAEPAPSDAPGYEPSGPPTIGSDKADYAPGELVTLTGSNWYAGEAVHIRVNDDAGSSWSRDVDVIANDQGTITDQFTLPSWFVAMYSVAATGEQSGGAWVQFTDASLEAAAAPAGVTFSLTFQGFMNSSCTTPVNGSNGNLQSTAVTAGDEETISFGSAAFEKLTAGAASAPSGAAFVGWTGPASFSSTNAAICVATPSGGNSFRYTATYAVATDSTPPDTSITAGPVAGSTTNDNDPSFSFTSSESGSTFECALDGAAFSSCTTPKAYTNLADGTHTFAVRATDAAGNTDPTPASRSWTIDTAAPGVPVITSPAHGSYDTDGSVMVSGTAEPNAAIELFDGATSVGHATASAAGNWSVPLTGLAEGSHLFTASAQDLAGNASAASDAVVITVDSIAPSITLFSMSPTPNADGWNNTDVTLTWVCTDGGSGVVSQFVTNTKSNEGAAQASTETCTDLAGNTASDTQSVSIDKTAPHDVVGTPDRDPNAAGWYNAAVHVAFNGVDGLSGIAACSEDDYSGPDDAAAAVAGSCTDVAGNTGYGSFALRYDATAPNLAISLDPVTPDGENEWYVSDVMVSLSADDATSLIAAGSLEFKLDDGEWTPYTAPFTVSADGSHTVLARVSDNAGNDADDDATFQIDQTAPAVTLSATGTMGEHGWFIGTVTIETNGLDSVSGIASCDMDQHQEDETAGATFFGSCTNGAGLSGDAVPITVKLDKTGPSAVLSASGTPGTNGWFIGNVTVTTSGADDISGPVSCTADQVQATETASTEFNGSCTNDAGLTTNADPISLKLDKTGPSALLSASGTAGTNGWFTGNVAVTTSGSDSISNPTTCTPSQQQTTDTTGTAFNGSCTNDAGLTTNAAPISVKLDKTNPSVAILSPATGLSTVAVSLPVSGTASDTPSGLASVYVNGLPTTVSSGSFATNMNVPLDCGANTISAVATDVAGRTGSASISVTRVCFGNLQYYQPLDQTSGSTPMNSGKYGKVIPIKVTFKTASGADVTEAVATANGWSIQIGVNNASCVSGAASDSVEMYADAGQSNAGTNQFRWSGGQWIYNLDTKSPPGMSMAINSCYRLDVYIADGVGKTKISTSVYALFKPTK